MKNHIRLTLALALLCAASTAVYATDNAYLYLVQGIPGHDYSSTTDPQFPVDVLINDVTCYARGLSYGTILGPLTFTAGTYDVKISIANSLAPCSNSPIVDGSVTLHSGKNVSAVLALSDSGTPGLETFNNNFSAVAANDGRILFALAADSTGVQLILQNTRTCLINRRTDGCLFGSGHLRAAADTFKLPRLIAVFSCPLPSGGYTYIGLVRVLP